MILLTDNKHNALRSAMLLFLICFELFSVSSALGENYGYLCSERDGIMGGTPFYAHFLNTRELKFSYVAYYQSVDQVLVTNIKESCDAAVATYDTLKEFIKGENILCKAACERFAPSYHVKDFWFWKNGNIRKQVSECQKICGLYTQGQEEELK